MPYPHAHPRRPRRPGMTQIYLLVCFPLFVALCGLAVDVGRLYVARQEAQTVADAAARYAARGMETSATPLTTARAHVAAVAAESSVDGAAPTVDPNEVVQGNWNASSKTFTPNPNGDAVSVTVRQTLSRPGGAPLFISVLAPANQTTVTATAVARVVVTTTQIQPPASGNLWLAGMPDNTTHNNFRPDNSAVWDNSGTSANPKQRPLEINLAAAGMSPGTSISLEGLSGSASYNGNGNANATNTADGNAGYLVADGATNPPSVPQTSANGISNTRAPIGAIMAVFLSDAAPNASAAPPSLDFGTPEARDYSSISPQLKQVFYVGDGKRSTGETQSIVIPPGATRVFFGMMDAWQWNDNVGDFKTNLYTTATVHLVK
jgi:Flp pilus assembly protein TadG